jgi:hypothetical protein
MESFPLHAAKSIQQVAALRHVRSNAFMSIQFKLNSSRVFINKPTRQWGRDNGEYKVNLLHLSVKRT